MDQTVIVIDPTALIYSLEARSPNPRTVTNDSTFILGEILKTADRIDGFLESK